MAFIYTHWLLYTNKNQPELNITRLEEKIAERTTIYLNETENNIIICRLFRKFLFSVAKPFVS